MCFQLRLTPISPSDFAGVIQDPLDDFGWNARCFKHPARIEFPFEFQSGQRLIHYLIKFFIRTCMHDVTSHPLISGVGTSDVVRLV